MKEKTIVIVGGGITGLSAAYHLHKKSSENALPLQIKLVEASERLGGKIESLKKDGFTIEKGPDSLLARKPPALKLVKELSLEDKMIYNAVGESYILADDKLYPLPEGTFMGVPKDIIKLGSSNLISFQAKFRALGDFVLPKS